VHWKGWRANQKQVEAMGLAGMKWAAENTWEKKVAKAIEYYPALIGGNR
jgi:hypothetical protein